jgi:hemoglobin
MQTVFEAAGGNEGLRRLADAWHRRAVQAERLQNAFRHFSTANHEGKVILTVV